MPFAAAWMDLEMMMLSKVSQKEKDKHPRLQGGMDWESGISRCNFIELVKMFILRKILGEKLE